MPVTKNPFPGNVHLTRAFVLADKCHRGQKRKEGLPYITHPVAVAKLLKAAGYEDDVVAAGLLHDVLEDSGCEVEEIDRALNRRVTRMVIEVSDKNKTYYWAKRKKLYLEGLKQASFDSLAVACADKADNLRSINKACRRLGKVFLKSFSSAIGPKLKNYSNILKLIRRRYPKCPILHLYNSELLKLKNFYMNV